MYKLFSKLIAFAFILKKKPRPGATKLWNQIKNDRRSSYLLMHNNYPKTEWHEATTIFLCSQILCVRNSDKAQ